MNTMNDRHGDEDTKTNEQTNGCVPEIWAK